MKKAMKKAGAVLLIILLTAAVSFAGEKEDWWAKMKGKVSSLAPAKKTTSTTAVGGVRAAKEEGDTLYWKGKDVSVTKEEAESFTAAVDLALDGKNTEAIESFESFLKKYPSSVFADDAKQSLKLLKAK